MAIVKWLAKGGWEWDIERVECIRETEKSVWESRLSTWAKETYTIMRPKHSVNNRYCDSWEEARDFLLRRSLREEEDLESLLNNVRQRLERLRAMTPPGAPDSPKEDKK